MKKKAVLFYEDIEGQLAKDSMIASYCKQNNIEIIWTERIFKEVPMPLEHNKKDLDKILNFIVRDKVDYVLAVNECLGEVLSMFATPYKKETHILLSGKTIVYTENKDLDIGAIKKYLSKRYVEKFFDKLPYNTEKPKPSIMFEETREYKTAFMVNFIHATDLLRLKGFHKELQELAKSVDELNIKKPEDAEKGLDLIEEYVTLSNREPIK